MFGQLICRLLERHAKLVPGIPGSSGRCPRCDVNVWGVR